jgi:hypothetical protein
LPCNFPDAVIIKETTKMESFYPEIAKVIAKKTMNELSPKIEAGLK